MRNFCQQRNRAAGGARVTVASGLLATVLVGGCPPAPPTPQQTDVQTSAGIITAPNASIVSVGAIQDGAAGVSASSLVGIVKDGKAYLYHPSLGNVDLSDETSQQALGAYCAERLRVGKGAAASLRDEVGYAKVSGRSLNIGASAVLANGLRVTRTETDRYRFENPTRRWAVVKGPTESVLLAPAIAEGVPDWARTIVNGRIEGGSATITVGEADVETYASMASIAMLFLPSLSHGVAVGAAITDGVSFSTVMDLAQDALNHDSELFLAVNVVELFDILLGAVEHVAGVLPGDCINAFALGASAARTALRVLFTQGSADAVGDFFASGVLNLATCACEGGTLVCMVVTVVKDLLILVSWDVQSTQGAIQALELAAYAEVEGTAPPEPHDSDGDGVPDTEDDCPDDPNKTSPGDCGCGEPETPGCGEQPGLVARWTCDGNALDASGNGNHGTASGAVLAADRFGNPNAAYHFDGVDDGVHVPNSSSLNISGNHSISITAWIRAASIPPVRGGIVWKWGPGGPEDDQYTLHLRDGGHPSFVLSDVWTTMVQAPAPVTLHAWTHVAGVYDSAAGQMRLYVNGTLADSRSLSYYNIQSTAEPVYIGRGCNLDDFFHGTIDDVRIYDRALSAGEVATLAQGQ